MLNVAPHRPTVAPQRTTGAPWRLDAGDTTMSHGAARGARGSYGAAGVGSKSPSGRATLGFQVYNLFATALVLELVQCVR